MSEPQATEPNDDVPMEIEQRWLVGETQAKQLMREARAIHKIIQGYLAQQIWMRGWGKVKLEHKIIIDEEAQRATLLIEAGGKELLVIDIPMPQARQLQERPELLNKIRIRLEQNAYNDQDIKAFITIKGDKTDGRGAEYEYEILPERAVFLLQNAAAQSLVLKTRYHLDDGIELDQFARRDPLDPTKPLYIAEREVNNPGEMLKTMPAWAERDITNDERYANFTLAGADQRATVTLQYFAESLNSKTYYR